jgi:hypothetical protein
MGRTMIGSTTTELQSDSGSVLWSFVQGEQLEYTVTLSFLSSVFSGYAFEAVVIEALNELDGTAPPEIAKPGGVQTVLTVVVPTYRGAWSSAVMYSKGDVVLAGGVYYRLATMSAYQSVTAPAADLNWVATAANIVYIRFPSSLSLSPAWEVSPTASSKVYGFFELRVSETSGAFLQTWKPMRGLVELQFSPTGIVP